jgi:hypothetical protein
MVVAIIVTGRGRDEICWKYLNYSSEKSGLMEIKKK